MYCSLADVENVLPRQRLTELTRDVTGYGINQPLPDSPDEGVVNDAIRYASERIDGFLRQRFKVPLEQVPTEIRDLAVNLVVERLYLRRPDRELPEAIKMLSNRTHRDLEQIRDSRRTPGALEEKTDLPESGQVRVSSRPASLGGPGGWLEKY
ncbi:DUF1320 domain-containing protein [Salmonella enterica]|nr:DUF1320 domain-containing protein [Salmonella enterica subsp. enterica serovar Panama]EJG5923838.1 DUF1320 domain-containing protein [Salmonella enterica]ELX2841823.1 DUF1320 domain-containing protein [Salmonella enterica]